MIYCTIPLCTNTAANSHKYISDGFGIYIVFIKIQGKKETISVIFSRMWDPLGNV